MVPSSLESLFIFAILYGGNNVNKNMEYYQGKLAPNGTVILSISSLIISFFILGVFLYLDSLKIQIPSK